MSDTFKISEDGESITCLRCYMTSYNLNDVRHRYCGYCHVFHLDNKVLRGPTVSRGAEIAGEESDHQ
jgi:hypothetical protein